MKCTDRLESDNVTVHHYDLLARSDWEAVSALVVSPYVEKTFFTRMVRDLQPATLTVVIDDGCRPDDVAMVQHLANKTTKVRVALGSAPGLVHAKVFYVEWRTASGNRAHTLVYGSANATRQAFEGNLNSELLCKVRLTVAKHTPLLEWIGHVINAVSDPSGDDLVIEPVRDAWLANGVQIRLPGLKIKSCANKADNFDLWLQRGRLVSIFRPDASFLRVNVNLLAELPAGELVQRVRGIGFETPMTQRLSIPYVPNVDDGQTWSDGTGHWRSRYFVWTQLGEWCSDSCFRERSHLFRKAGYQVRAANLRLLQQLNEPEPLDEARSQFLNRIDELWATFGQSAETYLKADDGNVDKNFYSTLFDTRVQRDLELAEDLEFRDRYVNGCEVINVPRFRVDPASWRSFAESFTRQLHLESLKGRSTSLIYQYFNAAFADVEEAFDRPNALLKLLRSRWNAVIEDDDGLRTTMGSYVDGYQR